MTLSERGTRLERDDETRRPEALGTAPNSVPAPPSARVATVKTVRVFVSSPGDVLNERDEARQSFRRLQTVFSGLLHIDAYFWEEKPMRAHTSFQAQIEEAAKFDFFICILWGKLGTPLTLGGDTGTQHELRAALESRRLRSKPDVLIYWRYDTPPHTKETREAVVDEQTKVQLFLNDVTRKDGSYERAFNEYKGFEHFASRFEGDMHTLLEGCLPEDALGPAQRARTWKDGSPFRGLLHFEFEHAPVFFGREPDVARVIDALKTQASKGAAFVLVIGASGAGKSSLACAGVVPALLRRGTVPDVTLWRRAALRPSGLKDGDLFDTLVRALFEPAALPELARRSTPAALAAAFRAEPRSCVTAVSVALTTTAHEWSRAVGTEDAPIARLVLVLDQLEELFTVEALESQREAFLSAIDALARCGNVWVIATMRSDFYPRCQDSRLLLGLASNSQVVGPPDGFQLAQMIRRPAAAAGLRFEVDERQGRRLDELLRDEALKNPANLPLLEFALEELYEKRDGSGRLLLSAYHQMDGVAGALGKRAEESFGRASPAAQAQFETVFSKLVIVDANAETAVRQRTLKDEVEVDAASRELVSHLTHDRLLVADREGENGPAVISVAHEAMLGRWERLREWIEAHRETLRVCGFVREDLQRWLHSGRDPEQLLTGTRLERAKEIVAGNFLRADEAEFVAASLEQVDARKFRVALQTGAEDLTAISKEFRGKYPLRWRAELRAALEPSTPEPATREGIETDTEDARETPSHRSKAMRARAAALLGKPPADELATELARLVHEDESETVRREAATSLVALDSAACFDELFRRVGQASDADARGTLAHVRAAADSSPKKTDFEQRFASFDAKFRAQITRRARSLRFRRALPTLLLVIVPTLILSSCTAGPFKFFPGYLNYALAQGQAGGVSAVFQGVLATFLWGGIITLSITIHGTVFGVERRPKSYVQPWGALVAGAIGGVLSSMLVLLVITMVCSETSVYEEGWVDTKPSDTREFFALLLTGRHYFWPYLVMGVGLGVGMAMLTNGVRASQPWRDLMRRQTGLTGSTVLPVVGSLTKMMWRFAWPIPLCMLLADAVSFLILRMPGASQESYTTWHERLLGGLSPTNAKGLDLVVRSWKISAWGQGLSIVFDSITQGLGGFFCIVGLALGLIAARHGVKVEPRRN
jgi:hypothetical protein